MSATAAALPVASSGEVGQGGRARSTKSWTAALPAARPRRRLPAERAAGRRRTAPRRGRPAVRGWWPAAAAAGQDSSRRSASTAQASTRCSQLSRTSSAVRSRRWPSSWSSGVAVATSRTPSAASTAAGTWSGSVTPASRTKPTPSREAVGGGPGGLQGQAGLAHAAGADDGDQPAVRSNSPTRCRSLLAAEERREPRRQPAAGPESRCVRGGRARRPRGRREVRAAAAGSPAAGSRSSALGSRPSSASSTSRARW